MVTGAYHPEISSGGEQCRKMAEHFAGRAHTEVLATSVDPSLPRHDRVDGVPVTRIRIDVRSAPSRLRAFRRMLIDAFRLIRRSDVVHLHGYSSKNIVVTMVAKLLRAPIVMTLHTSGYDEPAAIEQQGALARWAFRSVDLYMSVSSGLREAYLNARMPRDRMRLVPNGIDINRFTPATPEERARLREAHGLPTDKPLIVFVGYFSSDKQPRVLFDAWLELQRRGIDARLLYVGATASHYFEVDPAIATSMQADAAAAGIADRVTFAGVTRDVPAYVRAADIFVLSSRREGLPVALLEAMACGLPCVASRLHGSTEGIIDHGVNGLLTKPGDVDEVADAMQMLIHDPGERARLGAAARATIVDRYSSDRIADRWLDAYASVVRR